MSVGVKIRLYEGGHCVHPGFVVKPGSGLKPRAFPAAVALLHHPEHGYVLFDTGYHQEFFKQTRPFPERFYAWTTPCHFNQGDGILEQFEKEGIQKSHIEHVVLSHFHADHIAAISEFEHCPVHCDPRGLDALVHSSRMGGVRKGYLKKLLPEHVKKNIQFHSDYSIPLSTIFPQAKGIDLHCLDLFGDASMYLVDLPGHAAGQVGLLARLESKWVFLLADACWLIESLSDRIDQHWLANMLCDDVKAYKRILHELRKCHDQLSDVVELVPSHCSDTINRLKAEGWIS
ncbi:MBL fold metallo-hydrolase [Vibrio sp. SCSIO 43132]|uniref:MBL fold metallo-hydrolase n=1 Tax=Vibrio sp. SCSIO 43132 TaxID=2779363 RepID=UPI001CA96BE4|nr:MBL fold metallo-hydrolase [Vibrio sp. SCSIO 43132]UAB71146.1 MBL fold metallo-hydrolase [Vibrio sp. SCSIO 43132]